MIPSGKNRPLVSIVIPVYNAEKYLGYCLNSVMSQTYTQLEVILINDGSTDGSLAICQRYADMDPRFRVFDIPNGGVSGARNLGVSKAEGSYIAFVDSDDTIHPEMIEQMVAAEEEYHTGLIVGNVQMVDFSTGKVLPTRLSSECVGTHRRLSAEEFKNRRMQLIWLTSLLEGLYGKLYSTDTWKKNHVQCPVGVSLGEDFIANLQYFAACQGVYFLDQTVYYYNNIQNSNSLTHQYRPDLFQTKMMLMDELEKHLGGIARLSGEALTCFYNYVASSGLYCVERLRQAQGVAAEEKQRILRLICGDARFMEALNKAAFIHPQYARYVPLLRHGRMDKLLRLPLANEASSQKQAPRQDTPAQPTPGLANRTLRKGLQISVRLLGPRALSGKLQRLEQCLAEFGIRETMSRYGFSSRKRLVRSLVARLDALLPAMIDASRTHAQDVKDHIYITEQRQNRMLQRLLVNDLRQKKKALLLCTAEHQNIGDAAITLAEQAILRRHFPDYFQIEYSTYESPEQYAFIQSIVNEDDIIFISGGGNLGSAYAEEEELHRRVVTDFPFNKIIILPQTISFAADEQGRRELALSQKAYNAHPDLIIFARGQQSLDFARAHFSGAQSFLAPDVVMALRRRYALDRAGILLCLREDGEGVLSPQQRQEVHRLALRQDVAVERSTNMALHDVSREMRSAVVHAELRRFAGKRLVITDRLHGLIFALVTGTPVIVLRTANQKITEYYDAFLKDAEGCCYIGADMEKLEAAMQGLLRPGIGSRFDEGVVKALIARLKDAVCGMEG